MKSPLKIVAISDTHTFHRKLKIPDGDFLIHAGDFTKKGSFEDVKDFNEFLGTLPHKHKIVIAGNHDFCFERTPDKAQALLTNCHYLQDEGIQLEGIYFYGSPWQPWFFNWAFNLMRASSLRAKWELIPEKTDILITHGPPHGYGDITTRGSHVGCKELLKRIAQVKPKYHIFGHIHEGAGTFSFQETQLINASSCTVEYQPTNLPITFDYHFSD